MNRDYTPIPFEYLEEMDWLSDAEFGRLIRGLLEYGMTGQEPELKGGEKAHWKRVRRRDDAYRESFEKADMERTEKARKAAQARWSNADDAQACASIASNAKNAKIETKNKTKDKTSIKNASNRRFTPPTPAEVQEYCDARNNGINGEHFVDYYAVRGWKVGKSPMKDWKAAVRTWERNGYSHTPPVKMDGAFEYGAEELEAIRAMKKRRESG